METVSREGLCGSRLAGDFRDEGATDEEFSGTRIEQTITLFVPFGSRKKRVRSDLFSEQPLPCKRANL